MKTKLTVVAVALASLGYSALGSANSQIGDVVQIGCTLPRASTIPGANAATVYSIDARNAIGAIIADTTSISYGESCTKAINTFIAHGVNNSTGAPGTPPDLAVPNCAPNSTGVDQGVWVQAASYPSTDIVAGVVPVLLNVGTTGYAIQQFTFVCADKIGGGLVNTESD